MSVITIFKKLYNKEEILEEDIDSAIQYCPIHRKSSIRKTLKSRIEAIQKMKEKSDEDHRKDETRIKVLLKEYQFPEKDFNFKDCAILIEYLKLEDIINDFGDLAEEAILLISLFGNLEQSIQYLVNHEKVHPGMKLDLYDALHFEHPKTSDWDPSIWRSLALKNMPGKLFTKVFPHADKIDKYLKNDLMAYQKDKDKSAIRAEILKNLTVAKTKEIESEKIFTSLDEFLDFKIKKFKSKSAPEESSTAAITSQEKEKKAKKEKSKPIQLKSALELKVEKQMEYWVKGKLGIDTRKKTTDDEMKKMDEFQKSEEFKTQRELIEVQELKKFEDSVINEYINLQSKEIKRQIEVKIQEDLFAVVDTERAKVILEFTESIKKLDEEIVELIKFLKEASKTMTPQDMAQKESDLNKLKSERAKLKKERDEINKVLFDKIKLLENTDEGFAKKRAIIRSAIVELLPPNKVLADYVAARLEKEKSNLQNATEMQMAKIYAIPDTKSKKEGEQETAPSPTISPNIELTTLYEVGKKCAYTNSYKNKRAALWFYEQGISEDGFDKYVTWIPIDDKESMPNIFIDLADIGYPGYYLKRLDKDDPRIATAGRETSCCQHVDGPGKSCAKHAVTDPNGALYAIFERSEHSVGRSISPEDVMVAQSWAWRGKATGGKTHSDFVFDSVESHLNFRIKNQTLLSDAFTYLGHKLVSEQSNIERVLVGKGRYANTPPRIGPFKLESNDMAHPDIDNKAYRDSKVDQGLIAIKGFPYVLMYANQNPDVPKAFVEAIQQKEDVINDKFLEKFRYLLLKALDISKINEALNHGEFDKAAQLEKEQIELLKNLLQLPQIKSIQIEKLKKIFGDRPILVEAASDRVKSTFLKAESVAERINLTFVEILSFLPENLKEFFINESSFTNLLFNTVNMDNVEQALMNGEIDKANQLKKVKIDLLRNILQWPQSKSLQLKKLKNEDGQDLLRAAFKSSYTPIEVLNLLTEHIDDEPYTDGGWTVIEYILNDRAMYASPKKFVDDHYIEKIHLLLNKRKTKEFTLFEKQLLSGVLSKAIRDNQNEQILQQLIDWIGPNQPDRKGITPIETVLQVDNPKALELLFKNKPEMPVEFLLMNIKGNNYNQLERLSELVPSEARELEIIKILMKLVFLGYRDCKKITSDDKDKLLKDGKETLEQFIKNDPEIAYDILQNLMSLTNLDFEGRDNSEQRNYVLPIVHYLIKLGLDPNDKTKYPKEGYGLNIYSTYRDPIELAMKSGFIDMAILLAKEGIPVKEFLVLQAIELGSVPLVEAMLEHSQPKIDLNNLGSGADSPLHTAINTNSNVAIVLLKYGINPNRQYEGRETIEISNPKDESTSQPLWDDGLEPPPFLATVVTPPPDPTLLQATFDDHLLTPTDPNLLQAPLDTPIMLAIRKNDLPLFEALIEAKADLTLKNKGGQTALMIAELLNREDMIPILKKARRDVETSHSFTPARDRLKSRQHRPKDDESIDTDHFRPE